MLILGLENATRFTGNFVIFTNRAGVPFGTITESHDFPGSCTDFLRENQYSYIVQATTPGTFYAPSTLVEGMYEPEVFGRTASAELEIVR